MLNPSDLAAHWDALYNGPLITDPVLGYILLSVERLLIGWAAWLMLRALGRYLAAAFPPPHTLDNIVYWLRWWTWLRLREFPALKIGVVVVALLLVLQIPAGVSGTLNRASPYLLAIYPGMFLLLVGLTQLLNTLRHRLECPDSP